MNKTLKNICKNVVKKYSADKNVLGIMIFGSFVNGKFDRYSDIDFYILQKNKGKYSRLNYIINRHRLDIIFDSVKDAKKYLKNDRYNLRRNTSHMLANGDIVFQRSADLAHLKNIAIKNLKLKTKYDKVEILMHKYSIDDFWGEVRRDIEKNDFIAFSLDSQLLLNNIIEIFIKLKGNYLRQPSMMKDVLLKIDKKLTYKIENFYKVCDVKEKRTILEWLVKYTFKKTKGPLPNRWVEN